MTYQDYLDNWSAHFGEETTGEYGFWNGGRYYPRTVHRLSEEEFNQHQSALDAASAQFQTALESHDQDGMQAALSESLPHELALII